MTPLDSHQRAQPFPSLWEGNVLGSISIDESDSLHTAACPLKAMNGSDSVHPVQYRDWLLEVAKGRPQQVAFILEQWAR